MFPSRLAVIAVSALALAAPRLAHAASVVDFQDQPGEYLASGTVSDGGLDFTSANSIGFWDFSQNADDGSEILITNTPVTLTKSGGGTFDLFGLDAGLGFYTTVDSFDVTYTANTGASGSLTIGDSFASYTFGNLSDITSVTFNGPAGGFTNFDNLSVDLPEPISTSLLGAGLIGLAAVRRRREG